MPDPAILIVEDGRIIASEMGAGLQDLGYEVISMAATGSDAVKKAGSIKPDLVLMDTVLQGEMDGIEAARQIISLFDIPVIFVTAYTDREILKQTGTMGACGYLVKPFNDRDLQTTIELVLYRHTIETRLKQNENRLFTTLKSINDAVISTNEKGQVMFMNALACSLTAWDAEAIKGKSLEDIFNVRQNRASKKLRNVCEEIIQVGHVVEHSPYHLLRKDGQSITIELSSAPIIDDKDTMTGSVIVFRDITRRTETEKKLEDYRKQLELSAEEHTAELKLFSDIVDKSPDGVQIFDFDGRIIYSNIAVEEIYGISHTDILGMDFDEINADPDFSKENIFTAIKKHGRWEGELQITHTSGKLLTIWLAAFTFLDRDEQAIGVISIIRDITERRYAEEALKNSEEKFSNLFHHSNDAIFLIDPEGAIIDVNRRVSEQFGFSRDEILKMKITDLHTGGQMDTCMKAFKAVQKDGFVNCEIPFRRKNGDIVPSEMSASLLTIGGRQLIQGIVRDITERKKTEEEIRIANEELRSINSIVRASTSIADMKDMFDTVLDRVVEISGLEGAAACLIEQDNSLRLVAHRAASEAMLHELASGNVHVNSCMCGTCARDLKPLVLPDRQSVLGCSATEALQNDRIRFHAAYPFVSSGQCIGMLCVFTRTDNKPSQRSLALLETVTAQIALAIANARLYEHTLQHSLTLEKTVKARTSELLRTNDSLEKEVGVRRQAEQKLLVYQKQLQSLTSQLSLIEENEKRRIATELHDCIGQTLALTKIKLGLLNKTAPSSDLKKLIKEILHLIEQTIKETRSLTFELSPPILYELGLNQAVKWLIDQFREKHGLNISFTDDGQNRPFNNNTRFFIFQAIRELLVNIVKHARSSNARIIMAGDNERLRIVIEDDGAGFPGPTDNYDGYGLFSIRERMNHINGEFEIISEHGQGTKVTLAIPFMCDHKYVKKELI